MAAASEFADHCVELLSTLGAARARRMFGGHGIYVDELFIAIVVDDTLYLKADDATRATFEQAGSRPFTYDTRHAQHVSMNYWTVPEAALESPAELAPWARLAMQAALTAQAGKVKPSASAKKKAPKKPTTAKPKPAAPRRR
jgi:DNA transformation protein